MLKPTAVFIETAYGDDVKCELLKDGRFSVRPIDGVMRFPFAYGFIPNSWAEDGDETDAVVFTSSRASGQLIYPKHVGSLHMIDNGVLDNKEVFAMSGVTVTVDMIETMKSFFRQYKSGVDVGTFNWDSGGADTPSVLPTGEWVEIERLAF